MATVFYRRPGSTCTRAGARAREPSRARSAEKRTAETETSPAKGRSLASVEPSELTGRVARALCDRETYCDRIGADKAFESADACMAAQRESVRNTLSETPCREFPGDRVSSCLTRIRQGSCEPRTETACTTSALCGMP